MAPTRLRAAPVPAGGGESAQGMMGLMPFGPRTLRPPPLGPVGVALTAYDLWRRLPERQRRQLLELGKKHGARAGRALIREASARLPHSPG